MATANNSRSGGNRPRTHPTRSVKSAKLPRKPDSKLNHQRPLVSATLGEIRHRLLHALAATNVTIKALRAQSADIDADAALLLRSGVAHEIDRQIGRIGELLTRRAP